MVATAEGASWCFEQLQALRDNHGVEVAGVLSAGQGGLPARFTAHDMPFYVADFVLWGREPLRPIRSILRMALLFRRHRVTVVQTHLLESMFFGRLAAWLADVPVRLAMITGPVLLESPASRRRERWTSWMDTGLIPSCRLSHALYRQLGVKEDRLHLIHYGIDQRRFEPALAQTAGLRAQYGWPTETRIIAMVAIFYGVMAPSPWCPPYLFHKAIKGHEDLIRAMPDILRVYPDVKCVLVGYGWAIPGANLMQKMQQLVEELGLTDSIKFTGKRDDIADIYRDIEISVQAPLSENLGGSVESLMMAKPLVATRVGGLVDTVMDGKTGVLVEPENPRDLAAGILKLLRDPEWARELGKTGRAHMLNGFTITANARALDCLYRDQRAKNMGGHRAWISVLRLLAVMPIFLLIAGRNVLANLRPLPPPLARLRRAPRKLVRIVARIFIRKGA